jgi:hypothetical protein
MTEEEKFMENLLAESEQADVNRLEGYHDILLLEIQKMENQIEHNFAEAEKEIQIIKQWALRMNQSLQTKIEWIEKKLEAFIVERGQKTIELAHGIIKYHKKQDRIEISDMQLFLKHAKPEMLSVYPEQVKPDLNKIKAYIKSRPVPPGVTVIEGKQEFSYLINKEKENENGKEEVRASVEPRMFTSVA